jgi:hypothetical protein
MLRTPFLLHRVLMLHPKRVLCLVGLPVLYSHIEKLAEEGRGIKTYYKDGDYHAKQDMEAVYRLNICTAVPLAPVRVTHFCMG